MIVNQVIISPRFRTHPTTSDKFLTTTRFQIVSCPRFQAHPIVGLQFPVVTTHGFPIIISRIVISPRFLVHLITNPKCPTSIAKIKVCVFNFFCNESMCV